MEGFIRDELDLKLLVLYIMSKAVQPIPFLQLVDLALCDKGVDYFSLTQAVDNMVSTGQLSQEGERYAITERGLRNSAICATSLPYSVRMRCDEALERVNEELRRQAQVQAATEDNPDGTCTLRLELRDVTTPLLRLELLTSGGEQAREMAEVFRRDPGGLYHQLIRLLMKGEKEDEKS